MARVGVEENAGRAVGLLGGEGSRGRGRGGRGLMNP